jgi:uncharacterized protein YndB with AHSA1/START domain
VADRSAVQHGQVGYDVDALLRLWTSPLPEDDDDAAAAFREVYTDPVTVNGSPLRAADLVARARAMQAALADAEHEVLAVSDARTTVALAFRLAGRHVGPLDTPAGLVPPTGRRIDIRIIDVLTLEGGRISAVTMVADWLAALAAVGAVYLADAPVPAMWELQLDEYLAAPPEDVFAAMTESARLPGWWGPHGFSLPEVELDLRPGGRYRFTMQPPAGDPFHLTGSFRELAPPQLLAYTFRYEEPDPDDRETLVVLTLRASGAGTDVRLTQGPFATEERLLLHRQGWTESFERLRTIIGPAPR